MGVEYRANSGYGIVIPDEDTESLAEKLGYPGEEWGFDAYDFGMWLVEGHDSLRSDMVGDFMGGEDLALVVEVARVAQRIDFYGWDCGIRKFSGITITDEESEQLEAVYQKLYGEQPEPGDISWYMAATVS